MLKPNVRTDLRLYSIRDPFRANQPLWKVLKSLKCVFFYTGCRVLCIGDRGGCVQRTEMCENCVSGGCVWVSGAFVIYPDLSSWQKRGDRAINFECRSCSSYSASPFHPSHTNTHIPKSLCECWRALRKGSHICVSGGSVFQHCTAAGTRRKFIILKG